MSAFEFDPTVQLAMDGDRPASLARRDRAALAGHTDGRNGVIPHHRRGDNIKPRTSPSRAAA